jgi:hypothetical protein
MSFHKANLEHESPAIRRDPDPVGSSLRPTVPADSLAALVSGVLITARGRFEVWPRNRSCPESKMENSD